jgi:poly-gamma-glutamate synthesis protein (capsule biosynthesis protein)
MHWLFPLVLLPACRTATTPLPPLETTTTPEARVERRYSFPKELASARVIAVGDVLVHGNVKNSAKAAAQFDGAGVTVNHDGWSTLFEHVDTLISDADIAFANLETPVAPDHHIGTRSMVFNAPSVLLPALSEVGFDILSFANNHVYDQGRPGFLETMERLEAAPLEFTGAGHTCAEAQAHKMLEANGIRIAFLAASDIYNDNLNLEDDVPCSFELEPTAVIGAVETARAAGADIVVLSIHWGREYRTKPEQKQIDMAHTLMEGGVDVILGHHPHVVQPIEVYETSDGRRAITAFSLGNFISNQAYWYEFGVHKAHRGNSRDGIALQFDVVKKDYGKGPDGEPQLRTEIVDVVAVPLWTDNDAGAVVVSAPTIRVVMIDEELQEAHKALAAATEPEESLALKKRIEMLEVRRWQIQSIVGDRFMPEEI